MLNGKENRKTAYDSLNDEQKNTEIPYYVHEMEMARLDRINKRLWIFLLVILIALVGTNAGWIIYESQYDTYAIEQEVDTGVGSAYVAGIGDVNYGADQAESQGTGEKE